jgi:hypothetical protein
VEGRIEMLPDGVDHILSGIVGSALNFLPTPTLAMSGIMRHPTIMKRGRRMTDNVGGVVIEKIGLLQLQSRYSAVSPPPSSLTPELA